MNLKPLKLSPKILLLSLLVLSFIGFLDASYLTVKHYTGGSLECSVISGCETVLTSKYSEVVGVPIALGGAIYYAAVFLLTVLYFDKKNNRVWQSLNFLVALGMLASLVLLALQLFVIKAICQYCLVSIITTTLLFLFITEIQKHPNQNFNPPEIK